MAPSLKPLNQQVMVITGASSGIGLATARMAAAQGARLVLAARNGDALRKIAEEIEQSGGAAVAVEADVCNREDLVRVADTAAERFGGLDTWVNNAGVSIWGRLTEVKPEDHRKLFDTNFWGLVDGSLIAVERLRGRGGAIINLGSVASDMALPIQGMYAASKHAIKGFTDALRMELEEEGTPISVTLIKPTSINTPLPQHAKSYLGREPKLPDPVYPPEEVARAILHAAVYPTRDLNVGGSGKLMTSLAYWAPQLMDWVGEKVMVGQQMRDEPPRNPSGSLYATRNGAPGDGSHVHGDHPTRVKNNSLYTRAAMHPIAAGALVASLGVATAALVRSVRHR